MILGIVLASIILGLFLLIGALLITGKELTVHIKHTVKHIETCNCKKDNAPDAQKIQEEFNKDYVKRQEAFLNMDGVIAEVNKVMGVEVPDNNEGDR